MYIENWKYFYVLDKTTPKTNAPTIEFTFNF